MSRTARMTKCEPCRIPLTPQAVASEPSPFFRKTRLCKFFAVGACSRSAECVFAHGQADLAQTPDFSKTQYCSSVLTGAYCQAGRACAFAHSVAELRPRVDSGGRCGEALPAAPSEFWGCAQAPSAPGSRQPRAKAERGAAIEVPGPVRPGPVPPRHGPPGPGEPGVPARAAKDEPMGTLAKETLAELVALLSSQYELLQVSTKACGNEGCTPSTTVRSRQTSDGMATPQRSPGQTRRHDRGGLARKFEDLSAQGPGAQLGSETDADLAWVIKKTFVTLPDDDVSRPLRRTQSSPALLRRP